MLVKGGPYGEMSEILWQSPKSYQATILYNEFEIILLKLLPQLPGTNELKNWAM